MSKIFYQDKPITGLEVSNTGIKLMSIDSKKWLVLGYGSSDLDPVKIRKSLDEESDDYLSDNISLLIKEKLIGTISSKHVVIGVPTGKSFARTFNLPAKEEKNLKDAVDIEVDQYIPVPASALYIDYEVIDRKGKEITVLMSAITRTVVDRCIEAAQKAGLEPVLVEPSISSVARVMAATEDGDLPTVIVDIGPSSTDIAVMVKGVVRITGSLGIGGNTFTLDISKKLGVSLENAHQLKVLNGLSAGSRQAKITAALEPSLEHIIRETQKVMRYYTDRMPGQDKLEQLLVVGSGSDVPGIGEYFTNAIFIAARVASPWQKLDFGKLPEPAKQYRSRYIAVAGLASINPTEVLK